jgi:hypothetical protein
VTAGRPHESIRAVSLQNTRETDNYLSSLKHSGGEASLQGQPLPGGQSAMVGELVTALHEPSPGYLSRATDRLTFAPPYHQIVVLAAICSERSAAAPCWRTAGAPAT